VIRAGTGGKLSPPMPSPDFDDIHPDEALRRWRLILGRYAAQPLSHAQFDAGDWKLDQALEYL